MILFRRRLLRVKLVTQSDLVKTWQRLLDRAHATSDTGTVCTTEQRTRERETVMVSITKVPGVSTEHCFAEQGWFVDVNGTERGFVWDTGAADWRWAVRYGAPGKRWALAYRHLSDALASIASV